MHNVSGSYFAGDGASLEPIDVCATHTLTSPEHAWYVFHCNFVWIEYTNNSCLLRCLLLRLNDVVAVGDNEFYFTNTVHRGWDQFLLLPWGSVAYYDGQRASYVKSGLLLANGINVSPNKK